MYRPEWLAFSPEQRQTLAEHFEMKRTVSVETMGNTVICDGFGDPSIYAINLEEAEEILGLNKKTNEKQSKKKGADKRGILTSRLTKSQRCCPPTKRDDCHEKKRRIDGDG